MRAEPQVEAAGVVVAFLAVVGADTLPPAAVEAAATAALLPMEVPAPVPVLLRAPVQADHGAGEAEVRLVLREALPAVTTRVVPAVRRRADPVPPPLLIRLVPPVLTGPIHPVPITFMVRTMVAIAPPVVHARSRPTMFSIRNPRAVLRRRLLHA